MSNIIVFHTTRKTIIIDLENNKFSLGDYSLETKEGSASFFFKDELVIKINEFGDFEITAKNIPDKLDKEFKFLNAFHDVYFQAITPVSPGNLSISTIVFLNYYLFQGYIKEHKIKLDSDFDKKLLLKGYKMSKKFWNQILEYSKAFYIIRHLQKEKEAKEDEFDFSIPIKKVLKI